MTYIQGIKEILPFYKAFFIDLWGVVHDGVKAYEGVVECLNFLFKTDKEILFVSNSPRPGSLNYQKLKDLGIDLNPDSVLTSGDLLRVHMATPESSLFQQLGPKFYHQGAERNQDLLSGLDLIPVHELQESDFVLFSAYIDPEEEQTSYDSFLKECLDLGVPLVCANPDREAVHGDKIRYCAGYFAHRYEKMGGEVYYYGKPHPFIFTLAKERMKAKGIEEQEILMIGDTLETDIKGALSAGLPSLLVLSGNAAREAQSSSLEELCQQKEIKPTWILPSLVL
jgi:HAD superfamily hydrolase (TIGR01459 family)